MSMNTARVFVLASVVLIAGVAHADPAHWYEGAQGKRRLTHLGLTTLGGALYLSSETFLKASLAPSECRWCNPTSVDRSVRDALRWDDTGRAKSISNITGYALAPAAGIGLLVAASLDSGEGQPARWIDDTLPVLESIIVAGLVNQTVKFSVGEQRPFVHFGDPARPHQVDDDVSFYSGHTTLAFSIATSAGVVAHQRHYKLEPLIWASGYLLAGTTGYLRIAADQHYFTDVVVGALAGTGIGLAVPLLFHSRALAESNVQVVPTGSGVAVLGRF
jgi:hypothetical protein